MELEIKTNKEIVNYCTKQIGVRIITDCEKKWVSLESLKKYCEEHNDHATFYNSVIITEEFLKEILY